MNPVNRTSVSATHPVSFPNSEWSVATLRTMAARFGVVPWMFASGTAEMRETSQS